jgi:hypothetical protein
MKPTLPLRVSTLARLLAVLAVTTLLLMGQPKAAAAFCKCFAGGGTQTVSGQGNTCEEAAAKAEDNASRYVDCGIDGICGMIFVVDTPCYWEELWQMYQVDGHISYKCYVCF